MMKLINLPPRRDRVTAEAELVEKIKAVIYEYAEVITVAQAYGCIQIVIHELWSEQ